MKLGQLKRVVIDYQGETITFMVRAEYGIKRAYLNKLRDIGPALDASGVGEKFSAGLSLEQAARELLIDAVVSVSGIEDDAGEPVQWSADLIDKLPDEIVEELIAALAGRDRKLQPSAEAQAEGNAS